MISLINRRAIYTNDNFYPLLYYIL